MSRIVIFDIETGPLPISDLMAVLPPWDPASAGAHPGEFDPASVKTGNLKDESKIQAKIAESAERHAQAVADYEAKLSKGESSHWESVMDKAALSAITGKVVAIGYQGRKRSIQYANSRTTERSMLESFWSVYRDVRSTQRSLVGFNSEAFDVPFIIQRSWILGIEVPSSAFTPTGYLDSHFIDLMRRWKCGNRGFGQPGHSTLDAVCKACGIGGKPANCTGAEVASLLAGDDDDIATALSYIHNDLDMTAALADRLGVS